MLLRNMVQSLTYEDGGGHEKVQLQSRGVLQIIRGEIEGPLQP